MDGRHVQGTTGTQNEAETGLDTPPRPPDQELLQQRVAKDCVAKVLFQGRATQQGVDKLVEYLKLMKDTLPNES